MNDLMAQWPPNQIVRVKTNGTGFELWTPEFISVADTNGVIATAYRLAFTRDSLATALAAFIAATYATITNLNLKSPIASPTFTGTVSGVTKTMVGLSNCDNTTDAGKPVSTATQTALNLKQTIPTAGQGLGGTVTQATSKTTAVTLNKQYGRITMNGAALAAAAEVAFTLTNSTIAATDVIIVNIQSVGTAGSYFVTVGAVAAGSCSITLGNTSAASLSQAVVLNFAVIKSVID